MKDKQTDLKDHIIKSRIKPIEEAAVMPHIEGDPSTSTGKPQQQIQKLENRPDSKTRVIPGRRVFFGAKVDGVLLGGFRAAVKRNGHSYCYLLEGWMRAYLEGEQNVIAFMRQGKLGVEFDKTVVVVQNLCFDRYVSRPRRIYRKKAGAPGSNPGEVRVEERGSPGECGRCGSDKVVGKEFYWKNKHNCLETWVCNDCHSLNMKRGFVHGFREVDKV